MNEIYCVYKHTCPNGKVYIGITSKNPLNRWRNGHGYHNNPHFWNAIVKYGWDNIKHEILFDGLTEKEACEKETELIAQYKSNEKDYGYNRDSGGVCNKRHSEETKQKIRNSLIGHEVSESTRKKQTSVYIEAFGEKHSINEWSKIVGLDAKTIYARIFLYDIPIETALTAKQLRGEKIKKQVVQYNDDMTIMQRYESITDAEKTTGIRHIGDCCKGKRKTAGGYLWKYA